jgi:hypothetical protein
VRLVPVRDAMKEKGEIVIQQRPYYRTIQHRIIAVRPPDLDAYFSARDIALVNEVIEALSSHTATQVSDLSHGIAWRIALDREVIPYEAALLAEPVLGLKEIAEAHQLIQKYGWVDA